MRAPRLTIRLLMMAILMAGLATWAALAVERARLDQIKSNHLHIWLNDITSAPAGTRALTVEQFGFWHAYPRTLLGLPWDWKSACSPGGGPSEFACSHDHPEIVRPTPLGVQLDIDWESVRAIRNGRAEVE